MLYTFTDVDFNDAVGKEKTMCIVDSGIAFNSPYPALLRAERKVELILSFDFSQLEKDNEPPFKVSSLYYFVIDNQQLSCDRNPQ